MCQACFLEGTISKAGHKEGIGNLWLKGQVLLAAFYMNSFIETWPHPFIFILSMDAFMPKWQSWVAGTETHFGYSLELKKKNSLLTPDLGHGWAKNFISFGVYAPVYNHEFNCPEVGFFESGVADKDSAILWTKFRPFSCCKEFFVSSIREAASLTLRTELKITRIEC